MNTLTVTKKEYRQLRSKAIWYDYISEILKEENMFSPPPTRNVKDIVSAFRRTKKYSNKFLEALGRGLKRSSHFSESITTTSQN